MVYTNHGHHIPGTVLHGERPDIVARCGGIHRCTACQLEAKVVQEMREHTMKLVQGDTVVVYENPENYQDRAKKILEVYIESQLDSQSHKPSYEIFVVWFSKTLQNWKCLLSTTLPDGMYYELTHDGDKGQTYVDPYKKVGNTIIVKE